MEQKIALRTQTPVLTIPEDFSQIRQHWIEAKEQELERAETAFVAFSESGATDRRIRRTKERINLLKKVVRALKNGFVPIPRFDSTKLTLDFEELPLNVIVAVNQAKAQFLFDEFRLITGREAVNRRGRLGRLAQRDPLVVGVVRTPEIIDRINDWTSQRWSLEEHFLIAWWRPEDERMEEMF